MEYEQVYYCVIVDICVENTCGNESIASMYNK